MESSEAYDAIVVGARCAGSPTAMLMARKGYRVLLVDRDEFPSDTLSTLMVHPPGIASLSRWGLLDRLVATGCPAIPRYSYHFGPFSLSGRPAAIDGIAVGYGPRRTILDKLLLDAAVEAGVEVRERFSVEEILFEDGRVTGVRGHTQRTASVIERARVVVGADGRHSVIAKAVRPEQYNERPPLNASYYTYWSELPIDGLEIYIRPYRGWGVIPTHDNLTLLVLGWPYAEFETNKKDVEGNYFKTLELVPEFADRVRDAKRQGPFRGGAVQNYFRKPFGPGWALVGDAGFNKDPITAWGISDAFRDAELCATALTEWLLGARPFDDAMADYQRTRDRHSMPMFELTCNFATLAPPPAEMQQLFAAAASNQHAQDQFVSMMAGTLPVADFFSADNVGQIMSRPGSSQTS